MPKESKSKADWEAIRAEWDAGMLDVREIARQNGVSEAAIRQRAKRKLWPARPAVSEHVRAVVRSANMQGEDANISRVGLSAFERAIQLIHRHRRFLSTLNGEWVVLIEEFVRMRTKRAESGRTFTPKELVMMAEVLSKASQAMAKLVPLERRAFGFTDQEGPSEFDMLTAEDVAAIEEAIRAALER